MIEEIISRNNSRISMSNIKRSQDISTLKSKNTFSSQISDNKINDNNNESVVTQNQKSYFIDDDFWNDGIKFKQSNPCIEPIRTKPKITNERNETFMSCK